MILLIQDPLAKALKLMHFVFFRSEEVDGALKEKMKPLVAWLQEADSDEEDDDEDDDDSD